MDWRQLAKSITTTFVVLVSTSLYLCAAQEPRFEGRTLAEWQRDLGDLSWGVRGKAIAVLSHFGASAVPSLTRIVPDTDPRARLAAVHALGGLGISIGSAAKDATPVLLRAIRSELPRLQATAGVDPAWVEWQIRNSAAGALSFIGPVSPEVVPTLANVALTDTSTEVRQAAIKGLGYIGPAAQAAIPALRRILAANTPGEISLTDDADWLEIMKTDAADALRKIEGR